MGPGPARSDQEHLHMTQSLKACEYKLSLLPKMASGKLAVVTLQTFYLGKHDLLTVYLGKLDFLSVTDFSPDNLPRENFIVWVLDMSRKQ